MYYSRRKTFCLEKHIYQEHTTFVETVPESKIRCLSEDFFFSARNSRITDNIHFSGEKNKPYTRSHKQRTREEQMRPEWVEQNSFLKEAKGRLSKVVLIEPNSDKNSVFYPK